MLARKQVKPKIEKPTNKRMNPSKSLPLYFKARKKSLAISV